MLRNLIAVKYQSNQDLKKFFEEISPIEDFQGSMSLSFRDHRFEPPKYTIAECKERDITYAAPLFLNRRVY